MLPVQQPFKDYGVRVCCRSNYKCLRVSCWCVCCRSNHRYFRVSCYTFPSWRLRWSREARPKPRVEWDFVCEAVTLHTHGCIASGPVAPRDGFTGVWWCRHPDVVPSDLLVFCLSAHCTIRSLSILTVCTVYHQISRYFNCLHIVPSDLLCFNCLHIVSSDLLCFNCLHIVSSDLSVF